MHRQGSTLGIILDVSRVHGRSKYTVPPLEPKGNCFVLYPSMSEQKLSAKSALSAFTGALLKHINGIDDACVVARNVAREIKPEKDANWQGFQGPFYQESVDGEAFASMTF
jgi:hypothetical protein